MVGVLIADDEVIIRYGIKSMIDWDKLGLTVIGDAANGKEALELFYTYKPEIVITDIKMPVMDGIELIRAIREDNQDTKIIILSCLQDFACAKEAIRLGASEYLVKSDMMPSDMEAVLKKVKETIDLDMVKRGNTKVNKINTFTAEIEKERFLRDLTSGAVTGSEEVKASLQELDMGYLISDTYVLAAGIDYFEKVTCSLNEKQKKDIGLKLINIIQNAISESPICEGEAFPGNPGEIIALISIKHNHSKKGIFDALYAVGEAAIRQTGTETDYSISIGLSNLVENPLNIRDGYSEALMAYRNKMFFGCGRVISYQDVQLVKNPGGRTQMNFKELQENVYFLKRDKVISMLDSVFDKLQENRDLEGVNLLSMELVLILNTIYSDTCRDSEEVYNKKKEYYDQVKYLETLGDIRDWFEQSFKQIIEYVSAVYNDDKSIIAKAVSYVNKNFSSDISLQTISDHVHLSKNYFVSLFKRETGESFIEYLTRVRIKNARELLRNSRLKASEVGTMVGIEDQRYFSKVFKKITGYTPTEYKDLKR